MASPGSVVIQFIAKTKDAGRDVVDFARQLGKVDDATKDTDRSLDAVGDEAERMAARLRQSARQMAQGIHAGAKDIDTETGHIKRNMAETGKEAGTELISNIAEGIGSGTANLTDVVSGTLGGITNLAAAFPGIGTAAAAAAGVAGIALGKLKGDAEKAQARIDAVRSALEDLATASAAEQTAAVFKAWVDETKKVPGQIEKIDNVIQQANVPAETFQRAIAGDPDSVNEVVRLLGLQGQKIIIAQKNHQKLTAEQQAYLDDMGLVLGEVKKWDSATGAVRREQKAINDLQGTGIENTKEWKKWQEDVAEAARKTKEELDEAAKDRRVTFTVDVKKGQTMGEVLEGLKGGTTAAAVPARAAGPAVTVQSLNFYSSSTGRAGMAADARELKAILERNDIRQGRRRGAPRAVAW